MSVDQLNAEVLPPPYPVIKDDFTEPRPDIWSLKRIESGRYSYTNYLDTPAIKIDIQKSDRQATDTFGKIGERSEISETPSILLPHGPDVWYGFSFCFPSDFLTIDNRTVVAQLKQYTQSPESPFWSLRYQNGVLICQITGQDLPQSIKFKLEGEWRGQWHRALLNYQLGKDKQGYMNMWLDDQPFAQHQGSMGYTPTEDLTYFKMGLYRDQVEEPQSVYFSNFRRGFNRQDCTT